MKSIAVPFRMGPRVVITKFPAENSNEDSKDQIQENSNADSKDQIQTKRKYLCLVFDWHCQLRAKIRNLDQLRSKVQGHPKNPSPMSRPHQPQPQWIPQWKLGQLRSKVQSHPKNPSPISRPHQPQPFFEKDEMNGMDSMHWNAFHGM